MRSRAVSQARSRKGAIIALTAMLMVAMLLMLAFAVDVGYMLNTRTELQSAADASALAGAYAMLDGASAARTAASTFATANKAAGRAVQVVLNEDVELGTWDSATASFTKSPANLEEDATAVRVFCRVSSSRGNAANLFFARIIGQNQVDLSARAVAQLQRLRCGRIVGINSVEMQGSAETDSYDSRKGSYASQAKGAKGDVCSNGSIELKGSVDVNGSAITGPGGSVNGSSHVSGEIKTNEKTVKFPTVDSSSAQSQNNNSAASGNIGNGINLNGHSTLTLQPGTYYINGNVNINGGASIAISGPTSIYITGTLDMGGGGFANSTLAPSNLRIYLLGSSAKLRGNSSLYAIVYGPNCDIELSGTPDIYGAVIGKTLDVQGNPGLHYDEALNADLQYAPVAVSLVQ